MRLTDVVKLDQNKGFRIPNTKLQYAGEIECIASNSNGTLDKVPFYLHFTAVNDHLDCNEAQTPIIDGGPFELEKPYIKNEGGSDDVHAGDTVILKCHLVVPETVVQQVDLDWLPLSRNNMAEYSKIDTQSIPQSPGYVELIATNELTNIRTEGPFRCIAKLRDENNYTIEAKNTKYTFNLIEFPLDEEHAIEWHMERFNEVIELNEGEPLKWIIDFTIHNKGRIILKTQPLFNFTRKSTSSSNNVVPSFDYNLTSDMYRDNRFTLELKLKRVQTKDMGHYKLQIYDGDHGSFLAPSLNMTLYVKTKPKVTLQVDGAGAEPKLYYILEGEDIDMTCHVLSYPIEETRLVGF